MPEPTAAEVRDADLPAVLDEELNRLPEHYRDFLVLCDLAGLTRKAAARQHGIPEGSVASLLARARASLAKRLTRRGVVCAGGSVAALSAGSASASAPPALVASTIKVASLRAAGIVSARIANFAAGLVKPVLISELKSTSEIAVLLPTVSLGLGFKAHGLQVVTGHAPPVPARARATPPRQAARDKVGIENKLQ
jgi:RNA polymerase sigma-70 factor (ECF subfamily)